MIGLALASLPFIVFEFWFDSRIEREAGAEVRNSALRGMAIIETRLGRAVATLDALVDRGVATCTPAHLQELRMATFATSAVKELSILGVDGETTCVDVVLPTGPREVIGKPQATAIPETSLEVLSFPEIKQNMIRVRRALSNGNSIAALVAPDMLIPADVARSLGGRLIHARVHTNSGTPIAESGMKQLAKLSPDQLFEATAQSERYGVRATVWRTRADLLAANSDLRTNGLILCGAIGLIVFGLAVLLLQRRGPAPQEKLAAALAAGEFVPYYQPIVDITTGKLTGAEVLVRWRKPDGSIGMPGTFISQMEDNGLVEELSRALMRQAAIDLAEVYGRCSHLRVSFNLTADQFADEATVTEIRSIFLRSQIRLSQIVLELTERQEPANFNKTRQVIASMQVLGCKVALDDVGTGHSGLSSILKLGVDIIKIDKMFVDSMDDDRNSAAIIGTLVELARKLGMDTVAEGVEHFEQVTELRRRGIRCAQGFVFSPALPAKAYIELIDSLNPPVALPEGEGVAKAVA